MDQLRFLFFWRLVLGLCRSGLDDQFFLAVLGLDDEPGGAAVLQGAEQHQVCQGLLDAGVDDTTHLAGTELWLVATLAQPVARVLCCLDLDAPLENLQVELDDELVDDAADDGLGEGTEPNERVESVAELRREGPRQGLVDLEVGGPVPEADRCPTGYPEACVF